MRQLRLVRLALAILSILALALVGEPATAGVVPLSPWVTWVGNPQTDDGLVWYSRAYDEMGFHNEYVFVGSSVLPVSTPVSANDQYLLEDVDGGDVLWTHHRGPQWPADLFLEIYSRGNTQVISQIPWDSGGTRMICNGVVAWKAGSPAGTWGVYLWQNGETRELWTAPAGYTYMQLIGFKQGLLVWLTVGPWDGGYDVPPLLMAYDGETITTICDDNDPRMATSSVATDGRWVVWPRYIETWPFDDEVELWAWDGRDSFRLTNDLYSPNINGIAVEDGTIAWCAERAYGQSTSSELFVWRDGVVRQVTRDTYDDRTPFVDGGIVAWSRSVDAQQQQVLCLDGAAVTEVAYASEWTLSDFRDKVLTGTESSHGDPLTPWMYRAVQFTLDGDIVPWTPYSPGVWLHQLKGQLHAHYMAEDDVDWLPLVDDRTPELVVRGYGAFGYDFVAIAEHYGNNQYEGDPYIWDRTDTSSSGVQHIWDSMEDTASDSHLLGIGLDREKAGLPDWTEGGTAPDSNSLRREERVSRIQDAGGGMAVVAHPNVDNFRWTAGQVAESRAEGVEVYNRGSDLLNHVRRVPGVPDFSNPLALDVWDDALRMSRHPIWATAGDDYTVPWPQFDGGYIMAVCDTANPTRDDIMWALKCGSFYACKANIPGIEPPRINGYWADAEAGAVRLLLPSSDWTVRFATGRGGELLPTSGPVASGNNWEYTYAWQTGDGYIRAEMRGSTGISWTQPIFLDRQASNTATWPVAAPSASSAAEVEPPLTMDVADAHLEISTPQSQIGHVYGRVLGTYERPFAPPMGYVGECYEFLPDAPLDGTNLLSIGYEDADAQLLPESALAIYRYDETGGQWQNLATVVDTDLNTATCQIAQLGVYALSGEIGTDTEPPAIAITSPADSSSQSGIITLSAAVSDNNGVSVVRFWLDDISLGSDTYGADDWTRTVDLPVYPAGWHTITAEAEDASGNRSQTAIAINVLSAVPAPAIMLNEPTDGATFWIWESIEVSGSWSDDDPLTLGIIALDDAPLALATPTGPTTTATWEATVQPRPYSEGQRQLRAIGLDQHDNRAEDARAVTLRFFGDMPQSQWAYLDVYKTARAGIVQGYPDGTYHPEYAVTRDQMAVYIARALSGGEANVPPGPATATFNDVPADHWAFKYVEYCYAHGVVEGYDATTYAPDVVVDRAQMAVYVARAIAGGDSSVPEGPATATFDDVPTDFWAYKYVEYCKANGIVQGYDPVTYAPDVDVTRDQMAVYVARAFQLPL